jgi:wyosine [tRNA(Phe)-imidazoG37] synthetase (radical SAM superfamily)
MDSKSVVPDKNLPVLAGAAGLHTDHRRHFANFRFVYPVISRRARGVSLGINVNPDKVCNFDCIYCQVDRRETSETQFVEMDRLVAELDEALDVVASGELFELERFRDAPREWQRLNDIAFSGDGEPTTYRNFDEIISRCAEVKRRKGLSDVKLVLITNASMFHREHVQRGLKILDENNGEIWAKLDAGTSDYYHLIERTTIPFEQVLANITEVAKLRPIVIQSLFMKVSGEPPPPSEITAFCERLREIISAAGHIKLVQIYTVARPPAESFVTSLSNHEVDAIRDQVRHTTGLSAESFYGNT